MAIPTSAKTGSRLVKLSWAVLLFSVGCGPDHSQAESKLYGKWLVNDLIVEGGIPEDRDGAVSQDMIERAVKGTSFCLFRADGTGRLKMFVADSSFEWRVTDSSEHSATIDLSFPDGTESSVRLIDSRILLKPLDDEGLFVFLRVDDSG